MSTQDTSDSKKRSAAEKILKTIPAKEIIWVKSVLGNGTTFFETSTPDRMTYFLYQQMPDGFQKLARASSPASFPELISQTESPLPTKKKSK